MKLYVKSASNYIPKFASQKDLDKYIGTDRWVKVLYNEGPLAEGGHYMWLRLLKKTSDGFLANGFYDFQINHPSGVSLDEDNLEFSYVFKFKYLRVPNPIEAITTKYIYDNYLNKDGSI